MLKPILPKWLLPFDVALIIIVNLCALWWYKERAVFIDNSFYVYHIVQDGSFSVNHLRVGSILAQFPALLAVKLHGGLTFVSLLFSWGFAFYYSVLGLILLKLKQRDFFYLMLMVQFLASMYAYFWVASELPMAIAFSIFILAWVKSKKQGFISEHLFIWVLLPAYFLSVFFHPLNGFAFVGMWLIFLSMPGCDRKDYGGYMVSFMVIWILRMLFIKTPYETQASEGLNAFSSLIRDFWNLNATRQMGGHLKYLLPVWVLVLGWIWYWYIKHKNVWTPLLISMLAAGMVVLININFSQGGKHFYMENLYQVPAFFMACGLIFGPWPQLSTVRQQQILSVFAAYFIVRIWIAGGFYEQRLNVYRKLIDLPSDQSKLVIFEKNLPMDTLLMSWCAGYEIWQLSTMEKNESRAIVLEEADMQMNWIVGDRKKFHTRFENAEISSLPTNYFKFDTIVGYRRWPLAAE